MVTQNFLLNDTQRLRMNLESNNYVKNNCWASLVVQCLGIHLPIQETRVRSLIREDPTGLGAAKPVRHSYRACALEPKSRSY